MATIFYDQDADLDHLRSQRLAVLGFGSQGHAHALNLKDNGLDVCVGLYPGSPSWAKAEALGLTVLSLRDATARADIIMVVLPDQVQADLYREQIAPALRPGKTLLFAHGFNIHFGLITPPAGIDVGLIAPKAPGHRLRRLFCEGSGVPALFAVHNDASGEAQKIALAYAKGIGCTRIGVIATTFAEETETDLFGEQAVICGGISALIQTGFETLTAAGYQPEVAYFECLHEMKLIVDLIYEGGLEYARHSISDTAEYGDYTRGPRVIAQESRQAMQEILAAIKDGGFANEWMTENRNRGNRLKSARDAAQRHPLREVGRHLREMMWGDRRKGWDEPSPAPSPGQPRPASGPAPRPGATATGA